MQCYSNNAYSDLFNATLSIFDPYQSKILDVISFPGLSHPGDSVENQLHASGLVLRPYSDILEILVDNGAAFSTGGNNVSGPDYLFTMDLNTKQLLSQTNLTVASQGLYGGYSETVAADDGNTYVVGVYTSNILRVTPSGDVSTFYVQEPVGPPRKYGYTGLALVGDSLIADDNVAGQLVKFDVRARQGTPVVIAQTPYHNFSTAYIMTLPDRYNNTILLAAENFVGTQYPWGGVAVWRSKDRQWDSVEYLGFIPSRVANALASAPRQMADRIYLVAVYVDGPTIYVAGNSTDFVVQDITDAIDALMA